MTFLVETPCIYDSRITELRAFSILEYLKYMCAERKLSYLWLLEFQFSVCCFQCSCSCSISVSLPLFCSIVWERRDLYSCLIFHDCVEKPLHQSFLSILAVLKETTYYLFHYIQLVLHLFTYSNLNCAGHFQVYSRLSTLSNPYLIVFHLLG